MAELVYLEPHGLFTMTPPTGWQVREYPRDPRGKVEFTSPESPNVRVRVIAQISDYRDFGELVANVEQRSQEIQGLGMTLTSEIIDFSGQPAIRVAVKSVHSDQLQYLFLRGRVYYNIAFDGANRAEQQSVIKRVLEGFRPTPPAQISAEQMLASSVAAKCRRARLFINASNLEYALQAVDEGLALAPDNAELLRLLSEIRARREA